MIMMKTFNELYYISNTPWKSKLHLDKIKTFNSLKYNDNIYLHFDFLSSIIKVTSIKERPQKTLFLSAINICLRLYEIIKKLYPYNSIYVIIYTKEKELYNLNIDYNTFKSVIDILPNFAIITNKQISELNSFNNKTCKHIFYGNVCSKAMFNNSECQIWNILQGNLLVK